MATPEQLAIIDALWYELSWWWDKDSEGKRDAALRWSLQRQCGVSWLMFLKFTREKGDHHSGAHELIEALTELDHENTKGESRNEQS